MGWEQAHKLMQVDPINRITHPTTSASHLCPPLSQLCSKALVFLSALNGHQKTAVFQAPLLCNVEIWRMEDQLVAAATKSLRQLDVPWTSKWNPRKQGFDLENDEVSKRKENKKTFESRQVPKTAWHKREMYKRCMRKQHLITCASKCCMGLPLPWCNLVCRSPNPRSLPANFALLKVCRLHPDCINRTKERWHAQNTSWG